MEREQVIRMAREAGIDLDLIDEDEGQIWYITFKGLERFAALIREHLLSTEIHSCHANCERFACVQTRKAVEAEREACARVCDEQSQLQLDERVMRGIDVCAAAIRARSTKE